MSVQVHLLCHQLSIRWYVGYAVNAVEHNATRRSIYRGREKEGQRGGTKPRALASLDRVISFHPLYESAPPYTYKRLESGTYVRNTHDSEQRARYIEVQPVALVHKTSHFSYCPPPSHSVHRETTVPYSVNLPLSVNICSTTTMFTASHNSTRKYPQLPLHICSHTQQQPILLHGNMRSVASGETWSA